MEYEFDKAKSASNKRKHGIDFVLAQALWEDMDLLEIPARSDEEERSVVIGRIGDKHWAAIVTYRQSATRIISVRRARKEERELYES